jgi:hypothetical protein
LAYCVEKLVQVDLWTKNLPGSTAQNRGYLTIVEGLDICYRPKLLPLDFFKTIGRLRTVGMAQFFS